MRNRSAMRKWHFLENHLLECWINGDMVEFIEFKPVTQKQLFHNGNDQNHEIYFRCSVVHFSVKRKVMLPFNVSLTYCRAVGSGGAGGAIAPHHF